MAKTKAGKTTKGSRKSIAKRLGIKIYGGQKVLTGNIILRQRGSRFKPGLGTIMARDYTIQAVRAGRVFFRQKFGSKIVSVM